MHWYETVVHSFRLRSEQSGRMHYSFILLGVVDMVTAGIGG